MSLWEYVMLNMEMTLILIEIRNWWLKSDYLLHWLGYLIAYERGDQLWTAFIYMFGKIDIIEIVLIIFQRYHQSFLSSTLTCNVISGLSYDNTEIAIRTINSMIRLFKQYHQHKDLFQCLRNNVLKLVLYDSRKTIVCVLK